ncbi:hypothetical protein O1F49_002218 [Enterococcus hirae]|nr:hypothetical protein [Enterococcus hirae]EMF0535602.1 hypothetical protein [Enterococcus hirae]
MTKRNKYLLIGLSAFFVAVIAVKGFLSIHHLPKDSNEMLTFAQLQEKEGTNLKDLGTWQIGTILFTGESKAVLTSNGKELTFPIEVTNEEKNEITLPTIRYTLTNLRISQRVGLAQKGKQYFMYTPSDS